MSETMSETKYTPGPWEIEQRRGRRICIHAETWGHLAEVYQTPSTKEEGLANANLIAAAPELYEALKACHLQMLQSNNNSEYAEEANNLAVAAISHAEGSRTIQGGAARPEGLDSPLTVTHHQPGKL